MHKDPSEDASRPWSELIGSMLPKIDMSGIERILGDSFSKSVAIPAIDYSRFSDAIDLDWDRISSRLVEALRPLVGHAVDFTKLRAGFLPENWLALDRLPSMEALFKMVLDEGLPLAWVVPPNLLALILAAQDARARMDIVAQNTTSILSTCHAALDHVTSENGRLYADYARRAISAADDGHREAGQALATNTLDTLIQRHALRPKAKNNRPAVDSMGFKAALVLGALWSVYFSYDGRIDPPVEFRRHATAHGVSQRQYNGRNTALSLMHLVGLIRLLEMQGRFA